MSKFSTKSLANLKGVHPVLSRFFNLVTELFDCSILPGSVRTLEQQKLNIKLGLSQTLDSLHILQEDGTSHAVDAAPTPQHWDNSPPSKMTKYEVQQVYFAGFCLGVAKTNPELLEGWVLEWGGDWNDNLNTEDNGFQDLDHFQIKRPS